MIDIETSVFSPISVALKEEFPGIFVVSEPTPVPSKALVASIVQQDSYSSPRMQDNTLVEKFAIVMFQIDVYSNKSTGKKSQCKAVMNTIDQMLFKLNFMRMSLNPIPMEDSGYYRLTARYRAQTDGETFYRI
jgi:hypothetical protein